MECNIFFLRVAVFLTLLLSGCEAVFFYPLKEHLHNPAKVELQYSDLALNTRDGTILHGWFLPAQESAKGTVLQFHGNGENISTHYLSLAWLTRNGYNVVVYDYRGYGKSQGAPSIERVMDDAVAVIRQVAQRPEIAHTKLIAYGQSLGGAVAINGVANSEFKSRFSGVIVESAFSGFRDIAREKLDAIWLTWPLQAPLSWLFPNRFRSVDVIPSLAPLPVLIIHGVDDEIIPYQQGVDLFKAAQAPKEMWLTDHLGHIGTLRSQEWRRRLLDYLERLPPAATE